MSNPTSKPTQRPESIKNPINNQGTMAQPIPEALAHLVGLNVEFNVLIYIQCKYAVTPTTISGHFSDKHKTPGPLRKQLDKYIREFPFRYGHNSITDPSNGPAPQPIIPVLGGHLCKECPYKTQSRDALKKHGNQAGERNISMCTG